LFFQKNYAHASYNKQLCVVGKKLVSSIKIEEKSVRGVFQERPNRFAVLIKIGDAVSLAFLAESW
jgi:hypothetical protein